MIPHRYIQYLLAKQQEQPLTDEEAALLDRWYDSLDALPADTPPDTLKQQSWQTLQQLLPPVVQQQVLKIRPWWLRYLPAAAVLLLLLLAGYWFLKPETKPVPQKVQWAEVTCPPGKRLKMTMPEGSRIWLNGGTRLRYDSAFTGNRTVYVDNGEVFFDVTPDAAHPFTVQTGKLHVQVLGTAFNVAVYDQLAEEKITVSAGRVQVSDKEQCNVILTTDKQLIYNNQNAHFITQTVNAATTDSWRNGDIYLTNISLEELAVKLEHIYGYDIKFGNDGLKRCINSLHFNEKESITRVLELLKMINKINYEIHHGQIVLKGPGC